LYNSAVANADPSISISTNNLSEPLVEGSVVASVETSVQFQVEVVHRTFKEFGDFKSIVKDPNLDDMFRESFELGFNSYSPGFNDYLVAVYDGNLIVGIAICHRDYGNIGTTYICGVCVRSEYRKRGIGNLLMMTIVEKEKADDNNMVLNVNINERVEWVSQFYEKWGFIKVLETDSDHTPVWSISADNNWCAEYGVEFNTESDT